MKTKQWDCILPQAVEHFASHVRKTLEVSPDHFDEAPDEWLALSSPRAMHEYMVCNEYWLHEWSSFLLAMLIHELYQDSPYEFKR